MNKILWESNNKIKKNSKTLLAKQNMPKPCKGRNATEHSEIRGEEAKDGDKRLGKITDDAIQKLVDLIGAITKDIKEFDFLCLIKRSDKLILARVSP